MSVRPSNPAKRLTVEAPRLADVERALRQFPAELRSIGEAEIGKALDQIKAEMVKRSSEGPLFRRSGRLARSWSTKPKDKAGNVIVNRAVGSYSNSVAWKHELGFSDVAPLGAWIWMPTDVNLRGSTALVSPTAAREKIRAKEWRYSSRARGSEDWKRKFLVTINGERIRRTLPAMVFDEHEVPQFLLTKTITIPPRLQFFDTAAEMGKPLPERLAGLAVEFFQTSVPG